MVFVGFTRLLLRLPEREEATAGSPLSCSKGSRQDESAAGDNCIDRLARVATTPSTADRGKKGGRQTGG